MRKWLAVGLAVLFAACVPRTRSVLLHADVTVTFTNASFYDVRAQVIGDAGLSTHTYWITAQTEKTRVLPYPEARGELEFRVRYKGRAEEVRFEHFLVGPGDAVIVTVANWPPNSTARIKP